MSLKLFSLAIHSLKSTRSTQDILSNGELEKSYHRAVVKREYLMIIRDNLCYFCIKTYIVTFQLRGHNIWFQ